MPSACPGGRAPHLRLDPATSLYDRFGFGWTLLRLGGDGAADADAVLARLLGRCGGVAGLRAASCGMLGPADMEIER